MIGRRDTAGPWPMLLAVAGLFIVGAAVALVAPALDTSTGSEAKAFAGSAARGQDVYLDEGCVYCHTQQVRPVSNDVGLGAATRARDVRRSDAEVVGWARIGPDLGCFGDRSPSKEDLIDYLRDPRATRAASTMPRLDHLDEEQVAALADYLMSLDCPGGK